jgi:phosphopantothenoylcysteine decarboxylase/phosphopantothenate--cysteine ligase
MATPEDFRWDLGTPLQGDRALTTTSERLAGRTVAVLISGGIAAFRTPGLVRELRRAGAQVHVFVTPTALQFVTMDALEWTSLHPVVTALDGRAQHVEQPPDAYLLAPATYSTLNKLAVGIADNAVTTTLASALGHLETGRARVLLAPTMHGSMVNMVLRENLAKLANLGCVVIPPVARDGKALLPDDGALVAAVVAALHGSPRNSQPGLANS